MYLGNFKGLSTTEIFIDKNIVGPEVTVGN